MYRNRFGYRPPISRAYDYESDEERRRRRRAGYYPPKRRPGVGWPPAAPGISPRMITILMLGLIGAVIGLMVLATTLLITNTGTQTQTVTTTSATVTTVTTATTPATNCAEFCDYSRGGCDTQGDGKCDRYCVENYGIIPSTYLCSKCDPKCATPVICDIYNASHCDNGCIANWVLVNFTHFCDECDPNCAPLVGGCTEPGTCNGLCNTGYYRNEFTSLCEGCDPMCAECTLTNGCSGPNCLTSTTAPFNYVYVGGACIACDPGCTSGCTAPALCDVTSPAKCGTGYAPLPSGDRCGTCATGCTNCTIAGRCEDGQCTLTGYVYEPITQTCAECQSPNPEFCALCTVAGTCKSCISGKDLANGICS